MIVVYCNLQGEPGKQYGYHVYRDGFIFDPSLSKNDLPSREVAHEQARNYVKASPFPGHEILGGVWK